jgi:hypothetical protein
MMGTIALGLFIVLSLSTGVGVCSLVAVDSFSQQDLPACHRTFP